MADHRGAYYDQCRKRKQPASPRGENFSDKAFSPKRFRVEAVGTISSSTSVKRDCHIQGEWKTNNTNMARLCGKASELKDKFQSFEIKHVPRESNAAADAQANLGIHLRDGQVETRRVTLMPT